MIPTVAVEPPQSKQWDLPLCPGGSFSYIRIFGTARWLEDGQEISDHDEVRFEDGFVLRKGFREASVTWVLFVVNFRLSSRDNNGSYSKHYLPEATLEADAGLQALAVEGGGHS